MVPGMRRLTIVSAWSGLFACAEPTSSGLCEGIPATELEVSASYRFEDAPLADGDR